MSYEVFERTLRVSYGRGIGFDGAQAELWLEAPTEVRHMLFAALVEVARTKAVPPSWRRVVLLLLQKKKASDLVGKMREISLLSQSLKLLEACALVPAYGRLRSGFTRHRVAFNDARGIRMQLVRRRGRWSSRSRRGRMWFCCLLTR